MVRLTRIENNLGIAYVGPEFTPPLEEGMLVEVTFPNMVKYPTGLVKRGKLWGVEIDVLGITVWIELNRFKDVNFL